MLAASDPASLPRLRDVPMPGLVLPLRRSNNRLNKPITITPRPARVIVCMYHGFAGTTGGGTGGCSGLAWPVTGGRKSVAWGKSGSVRVESGGRGVIHNTKEQKLRKTIK